MFTAIGACSGTRLAGFVAQAIDQRRGEPGKVCAFLDANSQVALRPALIEFDDYRRFAQGRRRDGAARDESDADASADHPADGAEAAYLNSHVEVTAERGGSVHGESVNCRSGVQHDEGVVHDFAEMHARPRRKGVAAGYDEQRRR